MATQAGPTRAGAKPRRLGRPPKRANSVPTRERLITASIEVFVEQGFSQASVTDIAERAGVSAPAIYRHFDGKADLLIEAARHSLDRTLTAAPARGLDPHETARLWLADDFVATRRLLLELHVASGRETDLAGLLTDWHLERTRSWQAARPDSVEQIKAFYLLLLGLAQLDSLSSLAADPEILTGLVGRMIDALFDTP